MESKKLYKGSLQTIILTLLERQGKMYGYQIIKEVEQITKGSLKLSEGALYPTLHKLENCGILETTIIKVDSRMRKYYKLTENGKKESVAKIKELYTFIENMQTLVSPKSI